MSEYWISQGRKMCTYCKCWIADNKASINFHEQGKNHKENVRKKLDELRKKGLEDARKKEQQTSDLAAIEKAALAAFKQDISADPSMAAQYGISAEKVDAAKSAIDRKLQAKTEEQEKAKNETSSASAAAPEPVHYQVTVIIQNM